MESDTKSHQQIEAERHLEKAYSYKDRDEFEDVLREADIAIKIDPSLAEAHNLRGIALEELGNQPEAIKAYSQAIALNPEFSEAKNNLADLVDAGQHLEQAYSYKGKNKYEDVLCEADAAIQINPSLAEAHNLRGIALEELGNEPEAIKAYRQAIALNPEFREAKNNLVYLEAGQHLEQARSYEESGKFEDMLREADAAVQIDPTSAEAHNLRGLALEELYREPEAISAYKQAITIDPKFREAKNNLSDLEEYLIEQHQLNPSEKYTDPNAKYELVTVATYTHPVEANIAKSVLDREGIWAFIAGENFNRLYPLAECGLELRVKQPDAAKALELLNAEPDGVKFLDEELGEDEQREKCPNCQSPLVHYENYNVGLTFLSWLFLHIPILVLKRKWVCSACGHEWKS